MTVGKMGTGSRCGTVFPDGSRAVPWPGLRVRCSGYSSAARGWLCRRSGSAAPLSAAQSRAPTENGAWCRRPTPCAHPWIPANTPL